MSARVRPEDIRLKSDFRDFYDHHFAGSFAVDAPVYERFASSRERDRKTDHLLLRCAGLRTPSGQALGCWPGETLVVAYVDERAHRGDGKRMGTVDALLREGLSGNTYAVQWVGGDAARGRSLRLLSCGRSHYWLTYRQRDPAEWRSNVGDVEVALADEAPPRLVERAIDAAGRLQFGLHEPLTAIDFVRDDTGRFLAIDINTAPGLPDDIITEAERPANASRVVAEFIASRWAEVCL